MSDKRWKQSNEEEEKEDAEEQKRREEEEKKRNQLNEEELRSIGVIPRWRKKETRRRKLENETLFTEVDGDGIVPAVSMFNPGLRTDAMFELRGVNHSDILHSGDLINILPAIEGFPWYDSNSVTDRRMYECSEKESPSSSLPSSSSTTTIPSELCRQGRCRGSWLDNGAGEENSGTWREDSY